MFVSQIEDRKLSKVRAGGCVKAVAVFVAAVALWLPRPAMAVTINITYTDSSGEGFNDATLGAERKAAFEAAVSQWSQTLDGNVDVTVSVSFDPMGGNSFGAILGAAGANSFAKDFTGAPKSGVQYPAALANQFAGTDLDTSDVDITAFFNSDVDNDSVLGSMDFYYGTDGNNGNDIDFFTVVLHEMGHGLGFIALVESDGTFFGGDPAIFDTFLADGSDSNAKVLTGKSDSERAADVIGGSLYFNGANTFKAGNSNNAKLYAPDPYEQGSSTSHVDEDTYSGSDELMTPFSSGTTHEVGPIATAIFEDLGWKFSNTSTGSATKLGFKVQPSDATAGSVISPAIEVEVQDSAGKVVTTAKDTVTLAISTNPSNGKLSGTISRAAVNGVAKFDDLSIDISGNGYKLKATSGSLTDATSNAFNITDSSTTSDEADLLIKKGSDSDSAYAIDNTYQTSPSGTQIETQNVTAGGAATFDVKVENDADAATTYVVKATESSESGWTIAYNVGSTDVTSDVTSSNGYKTASLDKGKNEIIEITMTSSTSSTGKNATKSTTLKAYKDSSDTTVLDAVKATTTASSTTSPGSGPDLLIKKKTEEATDYAIDNFYESVPSEDQTKRDAVNLGSKAVFQVKLQNDGTKSRNYVLRIEESKAAGWVVAYKAGLNDITSQIKCKKGLLSQTLGAGATQLLTIEMTPGRDARGENSAKSAIIEVFYDGSDSTVQDSVMAAVEAVTKSSSSAKPDLLIKRGEDPDSTYALNNVYQTTPSGDQVKAQEASSGLKSTFQVKVQNDGSSARSYIVKAEESSESGWTIAYKVGSSDVTSQITSSSGRKTGGLAAGGKEVVTIEMTPGSSATGSNATKSVTIKVYNEASDTTVRDSVKAITSASSSALRASTLETDSQEDSVQGDLTLASVTASPNPVKVGGVVNFQYVVSNVGDRTEKN
ncbi:MAG: hypothetical protein HY318_20600, partial [Armatimonadetes bacterium]|nr:hypothetical protein [Armatimonadota bacterium]